LNSVLQELVNTSRVAGPAGFVQGRSGQLVFYPVTQLAISATGIREALRQQRSVKYLLPDAVLQMINEQGFYH